MSSFRLSVCVVVDGSYLYVIGGVSEIGKFMKIVERFNFINNIWDKCCLIFVRRRYVVGVVIK